MVPEVTNGVIRDEERQGWCMRCPSCGKDIRYTVLSITTGLEPFLYCKGSSDFVLRDEDTELVVRRVGNGRLPTVDQLRGIYDELEQGLDPCPGNGTFDRWANVKCPGCEYEFPYNDGVRAEELRYYETKVVWIEGAIAYRGPRVPSDRLTVVHT